MVGTETLNLFQWSGWRPKTHSHCRINCEKLVEGWLKAILLFYTHGGKMAEQKSFKERVKEAVIQNATLYKEYYVDYEYLLCSKAFVKNDYYIVSSHADNYLHLTGVHTELKAETFFNKCYGGTLEENDFDFIKKGQTENEVKGSVRRKINVLPEIMKLFAETTVVEEDFEKNRIKCALAAGNSNTTLGFVLTGKAKPMTLLKGNELNTGKAKNIDLVLRRKAGESKFAEMIIGSNEILKEYQDLLKDILGEDLIFAENET